MFHQTNTNHLDSTNLDNPLTTLRLADSHPQEKIWALARLLPREKIAQWIPSMVDWWGWHATGGAYWECLFWTWLGEIPMDAERIYAFLTECWWTSEIETHKEQVVKDILHIAQMLRDIEPALDRPEPKKKIEPVRVAVLDHLDTSVDLSSLHHPRLDGQLWFPFTRYHLMTSMKLTPCAKSLWEWALLQAPAGCWIDIDLKDFQAVSAEYRSKPYSMKQIRRAVSELEELQLIATKSERVRMQARHPGPVMNRKQKSEQQEIKTQKLASAPGTFLSTPQKLTPEPGTFLSTPQKLTPGSGTLMSTPKTLMSQSEPETLAAPTFETPTDLYRSIKENKEADLLKICGEEEECTQPPASLMTESKLAGEEPKSAGSDQSSAAAPTAIKETLAALCGSEASVSGGPRPRRREITRSIPAGYIEDVRDVLGKHQVRLEKLGIDLSSETLLETVNDHPHNLEPAIEAFFEKCAKGAINHPERYLNAAVREGWKPRNQPSTTGSPMKALTAEFLEAYSELCAKGAVIQEAPESLPVIMGEVNVRVAIPKRTPWQLPYELMPWRKALTAAIAAGQMPDIGDDEW